MKKVIAKLSSLPKLLIKEFNEKLEGGNIETVSFPYKGNLTRGYLFLKEDVTYLVLPDFNRSAFSDDEDMNINYSGEEINQEEDFNEEE